MAALSHGELLSVLGVRDAQLKAMVTRIDELTRRVKWFENQVFGSRTERRILNGTDAQQLFLGEMLEVPVDPPAPSTTVKAFERSQRKKPTNLVETDSRLKFGPGVPVQVVEVPSPEIAGLGPEDYEVVGERNVFRLAQNPGAYVVLKYVQKVVKIRPGAGSKGGPVVGGALQAAMEAGVELAGPDVAPAEGPSYLLCSSSGIREVFFFSRGSTAR